MSEKYRFVFSGKIEDGCREEEVKAKLSERFGMSPEKIEKIFSGKPVVIKRGLDQASVARFQQIFAAAGAIGEICTDVESEEAVNPESVSPPSVATAPPHPLLRGEHKLRTGPSGFWRRVFAFWIDGIIIAIPGWLIGWAFYEQLVQIGQSGRLIGFVIALCYFAVLNSSIGDGQTIGKRLLKIRVVDLQGGRIPLYRSTLRYLIFGVPYFCNGLTIDSQSMPLLILLGLIVFGLGGGILYLFIFNRGNRRTLHDFAVGTLVVKAEPRAVPQLQPVWQGHFIILVALLVSLGITGVMIPSLIQQEPFAELLVVQKSLSQEEGVHRVMVKNGTTWKGDSTTQWYSVNIVVSDPHLDIEETANRFARMILIQGAGVDEKDLLVVNVMRGFDIGIASGWERQGFSFSPDVWRSKLGMGRL